MANPELRRGHHRCTEIAVCGAGRFPLDMLRYDQCCPRDPCGGLVGYDTREFRIVRLNMYGSSFPSYERWQRLGWHVLTGAQLATYIADPSINAVSHLRAIVETTACLPGSK